LLRGWVVEDNNNNKPWGRKGTLPSVDPNDKERGKRKRKMLVACPSWAV
jgi:hypothetical protein